VIFCSCLSLSLKTLMSRCCFACDMPPACSHHIWLQHQACNARKTKAVYDSKLSHMPCSGQACFAGTAASSKLSRCQDCLLSVPQANTQSSHHRQPIAYQSLCVDHACTTSKALAFSTAYLVLTKPDAEFCYSTLPHPSSISGSVTR